MIVTHSDDSKIERNLMHTVQGTMLSSTDSRIRLKGEKNDYHRLRSLTDTYYVRSMISSARTPSSVEKYFGLDFV